MVFVVPVDNPGDLAPHVAAWEALSRDAAEPNVSLSRRQFLPALEAFGAGKRSLFLLVFGMRDGQACRSS